VLQVITSDFFDRKTPENYLWVAPCYTFKLRHSPRYQANLAAMQCPHLFYLPSHANGLGPSGAVRFELAQPVSVNSVTPIMMSGPKAKLLSAPAWAILQHRLAMYSHGGVLDAALGQTMKEYGEMVLAEAIAAGL
jgi:hypothetical protein